MQCSVDYGPPAANLVSLKGTASFLTEIVRSRQKEAHQKPGSAEYWYQDRNHEERIFRDKEEIQKATKDKAKFTSDLEREPG